MRILEHYAAQLGANTQVQRRNLNVTRTHLKHRRGRPPAWLMREQGRDGFQIFAEIAPTVVSYQAPRKASSYTNAIHQKFIAELKTASLQESGTIPQGDKRFTLVSKLADCK